MRAPLDERPVLVEDRFRFSCLAATGDQTAWGPARSEGPDIEPPGSRLCSPGRQGLNTA
jgi:hypothetical protein